MHDESESDRPKRVLISYSQESDEHRARVRKLADQLRLEGIDAVIDQYDPNPAEGWPMWMERHIREVDVVLLVFTEVYWRRAEGYEEVGKGLGVAWEADLIRSALYHQPHQNGRFVPILFRATDELFIMEKLKAVTRYIIDENDLDSTKSTTGYGALYRRITNQPLVAKPPLGNAITRLAPINVPTTTSGTRGRAEASSLKSKGTILIAETMLDVATQAADFATFLREEGYDVLVPQGFFTGRDLRSEYVAALSQAMLVVQVLGTYPFPLSPLFVPSCYQRWQLQQAQAASKPTLRWRSPSIDLKNIVDEAHRHFVDDDVVKCDPEDFKAELLRRLADIQNCKKDRGSGRIVFVHHHTQDVESADDIGSRAEEFGEGIKVALTDERREPQDSIGGDPVHGLMVVYGTCDEEWIERSVDALKIATNAANLKHNLKPPPCAVVYSRAGIPPLRRRPPRWKELPADNESIKNFVQLVQREGTTS